MCLSFGEKIGMSFLIYQSWLDICFVFHPLLQPAKHFFRWVEMFLNKRRTRLSAQSLNSVLVANRSNNFEQMIRLWSDRAILEIMFDQYFSKKNILIDTTPSPFWRVTWKLIFVFYMYQITIASKVKLFCLYRAMGGPDWKKCPRLPGG